MSLNISKEETLYAIWELNGFTVKTLAVQGTYGKEINHTFTAAELSDDIIAKAGGLKSIALKGIEGNTLPKGLSLEGMTISGTLAEAVAEKGVKFIVTAENGATDEATVNFTIGKVLLTVTPKENQVLYEGEPILYDLTGVVGDEKPLTGALELEGDSETRKIVQGSLMLNDQDGKNYTLKFSSTEVTATYYNVLPEKADVTLSAATGANGWYTEKDGVAFTAPAGFEIAQTGSEQLKSAPAYSDKFVWNTEGNHKVLYDLRRNGSVYSKSKEVKLDLTAPAHKAGSPVVKDRQATFTLTDGGSGIASYSYSLDGQGDVTETVSGAPAEHSFAVTAKAGQHTMTLTVKDVAGNSKTFSGITFELKDAYVPPVVVPTYYTVTLPDVEGATLSRSPGGYTVEEGYSFSFTLTLDAGYDRSVPVVTTDRGETLTADASGRYRIRNVYEDIAVSITGIFPNDDPTANAGIEGEVQVKALGSTLYIYTPQEKTVSIYTSSGHLQKQQRVAGSERIDLPAGVYFVRIDGKTYKAVIR